MSQEPTSLATDAEPQLEAAELDDAQANEEDVQQPEPQRSPFEEVGEFLASPDRLQAAKTIIGREEKARQRQLEAENAQLKSAIAHREQLLARQEAQQLDADTFRQRYESDPGFRQRQDAARRPVPQPNPEAAVAFQAIDDGLDDAAAAGMPPEWREQIRGFVNAGHFDQGTNGNVTRALLNYRSYIDGLIHNQPWRQQAPAKGEPAATAPPQENPRLRDNADGRPVTGGNVNPNARAQRNRTVIATPGANVEDKMRAFRDTYGFDLPA